MESLVLKIKPGGTIMIEIYCLTVCFKTKDRGAKTDGFGETSLRNEVRSPKNGNSFN